MFIFFIQLFLEDETLPLSSGSGENTKLSLQLSKLILDLRSLQATDTFSVTDGDACAIHKGEYQMSESEDSDQDTEPYTGEGKFICYCNVVKITNKRCFIDRKGDCRGRQASDAEERIHDRQRHK